MVAVVAAALAVAGVRTVQTRGRAHVALDRTAAPDPSRNRNQSGATEGIKVHGAWEITVRDPDGTLRSHREFENSVANDGAGIVRALGRNNTVGDWEVLLSDQPNQDYACANQLGNPTTCEIWESTYPSTGPFVSKNLVVQSNVSQPVSLVLRGSIVAGRTGEIGTVSTKNRMCPTNTSPPSCASGTSDVIAFVTNTNLQAPISVSVGQQVAVTVTITFT